MKIRPVGAGLLHAEDSGKTDRQTDRNYKAHRGFSKFFESAKKKKSVLKIKVVLLKFQLMCFLCLKLVDCSENTVKINTTFIKQNYSGFGVLVVSMLASGTRVRGFEPGRSRWTFRMSE